MAVAAEELRLALPVPAGYRTDEVALMAGVSYRMLDYWVRIGLVAPSMAESRGSGSARLFTHEDMSIVKLIGRLRRVGAPLGQLRPDTLRAVVRSGCSRVIINPKGEWARADEPVVLAEGFRRLGPEVWLVQTT